MRIGAHVLSNSVFLAPMAGITDKPFRQFCTTFEAGYTVGEMLSAQPDLRSTRKTQLRLDHRGESGPIAIQIMGVAASQMAEAARHAIDVGAQIIDINMGCPAKKVCQQWAGSALMRDEQLALSIIEAVVAACEPCNIPVTLKMRTGWDAEHRNAPALALAAQNAGIQMVVVHGRTRDQGYGGCAEYDTVAEIKTRLHIPVVVNGDIDSPQKARQALQATGADAVMIGRAALGHPWLFRSIVYHLATGSYLAQPLTLEIARAVLIHFDAHHDFYGEYIGVRSIRKHIGALVRELPHGVEFRQQFNKLNHSAAQRTQLANYFADLADRYERLPTTTPTNLLATT
jgi:tRNA-dihydrouridine synthase B